MLLSQNHEDPVLLANSTSGRCETKALDHIALNETFERLLVYLLFHFRDIRPTKYFRIEVQV